MVHARLAALIAGVRRKIEHVPDVRRPHVRMTLEALNHELMVLRLIFFGVVVAAGMRAVQVRHALRAVFAVSEAAVREAEMEEANPQVVQEQTRDIPAQIEVPADDVGDMCALVERTAHRVASQCRKAARIGLVNEVVEDMVIVEHVLLVLGRDGNLVGNAPADDARMIVVLLNQLLHLADGVFPTVGHMLADVRNLRPDDHAVFVAQIIEILVVLIVRQTDGVAAQLADECHVLVVHLAGDGVADALAILMAGYAVQGIGFVVEEEALLRVGAEGADAERNLQFVGHDAVILQLDAAGVEIRILHAVPAVRLFDADDGVKPRARADGLFLGVDERDAHLAAGDAALHADIGGIAVRRRRHADAAGAEIVQRKMDFVDDE